MIKALSAEQAPFMRLARDSQLAGNQTSGSPASLAAKRPTALRLSPIVIVWLLTYTFRCMLPIFSRWDATDVSEGIQMVAELHNNCELQLRSEAVLLSFLVGYYLGLVYH